MPHFFTLALYYHLLALVLEKIELNTVEEGECLNWLGAIDDGSPVLAMPMRRLGKGSSLAAPPQQIRVRALMLELFTHKRPPKQSKIPRNIVVSTTCRNPACASPQCASYLHRGTVIAHGLANMDMATSLLRGKRIAESRKHLRVLTPEQVHRIRNETDTSARELARQMDVNFSVVHACRVQRTYRNYTANPFTGLGQ